MYLHIAPNKLISEVQKEFSTSFPFLKIEFFQGRNNRQSITPSQKILPNNKKISEVLPTVTSGELPVYENMKVKDLESIFKDQFSLSVQVFRKSGTLWLETTMTDEWSLQQQNNHGREISTEHPKNKDNEDFDLVRDSDH